ncbi:MAG: DUF3955 domain-containing protein [Chloroflexota bacterium]|jgi:hypothetical protein
MQSHIIWWRISVVLVVSAVVTIVTFMAIGSYIDEHGILHEPFFLIPLFWLLALGGIITTVMALIVRRAR